MAHKHSCHFIFLMLALFILLPFGCGDDGKSGEETFETAPNDYQEGRPQVILLNLSDDLTVITPPGQLHSVRFCLQCG